MIFVCELIDCCVAPMGYFEFHKLPPNPTSNLNSNTHLSQLFGGRGAAVAFEHSYHLMRVSCFMKYAMSYTVRNSVIWIPIAVIQTMEKILWNVCIAPKWPQIASLRAVETIWIACFTQLGCVWSELFKSLHFSTRINNFALSSTFFQNALYFWSCSNATAEVAANRHYVSFSCVRMKTRLIRTTVAPVVAFRFIHVCASSMRFSSERKRAICNTMIFKMKLFGSFIGVHCQPIWRTLSHRSFGDKLYFKPHPENKLALIDPQKRDTKSTNACISVALGGCERFFRNFIEKQTGALSSDAWTRTRSGMCSSTKTKSLRCLSKVFCFGLFA